jgi:hypothetical protein
MDVFGLDKPHDRLDFLVKAIESSKKMDIPLNETSAIPKSSFSRILAILLLGSKTLVLEDREWAKIKAEIRGRYDMDDLPFKNWNHSRQARNLHRHRRWSYL